MNYTKLFYWLTVADNAKIFFIVGMVVFTIIAAISLLISLGTFGGSTDELKKSRNFLFFSTPFAILFWTAFIFTPSKKDAVLIIAGGQTLNFLTTDSSSKQLPSELSGFLLTEIRNMAEDAKVELGIGHNKAKILEEAKQLTGAELIEKMKTDTTLKNIILNN